MACVSRVCYWRWLLKQLLVIFFVVILWLGKYSELFTAFEVYVIAFA